MEFSLCVLPVVSELHPGALRKKCQPCLNIPTAQDFSADTSFRRGSGISKSFPPPNWYSSFQSRTNSSWPKPKEPETSYRWFVRRGESCEGVEGAAINHVRFLCVQDSSRFSFIALSIVFLNLQCSFDMLPRVEFVTLGKALDVLLDNSLDHAARSFHAIVFRM